MSDDESQPKAKLSFTFGERKLLMILVNKHYDVVNNKKVDGKSTAMKNQAWEAIHEQFLTHKNVVRGPRTPQQLKRCWENLRCKAKKGDPVSQKLLKWGENNYLHLRKNGDIPRMNGLENEEGSLLGYESDSSLTAKEDFTNEVVDTNDLAVEESLKQLSELANTSECQHCQCDKAEKTAKLELLLLEKRRQDHIYNLKVQNLRAKAKREKELHLLTVQELTLKVQNEKRKAEILDKEFSHYS